MMSFMSTTPHFVRAALALLGACLCLSACSTTRMQSPKQHRHLEVSGSFALDAPGEFIIPRVDAQATLGLFDIMDVSAHVGTALWSVNAGIGGRFYPTDWIMLGGQLEYKQMLVETSNDALFNTFQDVELNAFLRSSFVWYKRELGGFYGGPQLGMHIMDDYKLVARDDGNGSTFNELERDGLGLAFISFGLFVGYEFSLKGAGGIQFETSLIPFWLDTSFGSELSAPQSYPIQHAFQVGLGYTIYFNEAATAAQKFINDRNKPSKRAKPSVAPPEQDKPKPDTDVKPEETKPTPEKPKTTPKPAQPQPTPEPTPKPTQPTPKPTPEPTPQPQ